MNFIQTLYIDETKDILKDTFGWASAEYHIMGWALSCLQLNKLYGNVEFFANSPAIDILIDTLELPYSKVHYSHDNLTLIHNELWALPKLYTYSLQNESFLHVDGDVFLFSKFDDSLLNGELIGQNIELATESYYILAQRELIKYFSFFPDCVKRDFESEIPVNAINAGIFGGKNIPFFKEYTNLAFEYINKNERNLKNIDVDKFNVFFEQHLFCTLAKEKNIPISVFLKDIYNDNGYKHFGDFYKVPEKMSYLHLLGDFKRDESTCIQMAAKLRELYPDYYYKILELFKEREISLSRNFCGNPELKENKLLESENTNLLLLKSIGHNSDFQEDFDKFYNDLIEVLNKDISVSYLNERDIESVEWYRKFIYNNHFLENIIVKSEGVEIIISEYNWSGLFNKFYHPTADYYKDLQLEKGKFYHLVVPEVSLNRFSLYDIDELENEMLKNLTESTSIENFLKIISENFEDDVIENHYDGFLSLIKELLAQLILKKAIKPI